MFKRRSTLRSPQLAKKRKKQLWIKATLVSVATLLVLSIPPVLSHISAISIQHISVEGNEVLSVDEITSYIQEHISGSYLKLFSKRNIFLYPKHRITEDLQRQFSRIESVALSFNSLTSINVAIQERGPFALWCRDDNDCYFMDDQALIFAQAPQFSGNVYMRYHGLVVEADPLLKTFMSAPDFARIHMFVEDVIKLGFSISHVYVKDDGDVEMHTTQGGVILFTTREPSETVFENLEALLNNPSTVTNKTQFFETFTYIDLRFGKKIFLK